jgi:ATP-dependent DNA ligase
MRAVRYADDTARILTRNDRDVTSSFPELAARTVQSHGEQRGPPGLAAYHARLPCLVDPCRTAASRFPSR